MKVYTLRYPLRFLVGNYADEELLQCLWSEGYSVYHAHKDELGEWHLEMRKL